MSTTGWLAAEYSNCASSIRSSQRSGELQLISEMRGRRLLDRLAAAEEDLAHRDGVAGVDAADHVAHVDLVGERLQSRRACRGGGESSGVSFGSADDAARRCRSR